MRMAALICFVLALFALSFGVLANERVCVISGAKGNATVVYGGPKVRFNGTVGTYAFLRSTPPVDCTVLGEWLWAAYVEGGESAGFSGCTATFSGDGAGSGACRFDCGAEGTPRDGMPGIQSTYECARIAIAAGGFFDWFWYDKLAAYARHTFDDATATVEDLTAACRLLEIVTGFTDEDRAAVSRQVDQRADLESYRLAPLLETAALAPSAALRSALQERLETLVEALPMLRMDALLELACLCHVLGGDSMAAADEISDAILGLRHGGGFQWSAYSPTPLPSLWATLNALQALDELGRLDRVDAGAVRSFVLECWVSPGFVDFPPADIMLNGTRLHDTYVGTECLAILENREQP